MIKTTLDSTVSFKTPPCQGDHGIRKIFVHTKNAEKYFQNLEHFYKYLLAQESCMGSDEINS